METHEVVDLAEDAIGSAELGQTNERERAAAEADSEKRRKISVLENMEI